MSTAGGGGLPFDNELPALRAIGQDGVEETLRRAGLRPPFGRPELLRYHPARRCTFTLRAGGRRLIAKAYHRDVAGIAALLTTLERHGLASGRAPTAPPLVAYDTELRLVVTLRLDGRDGAALLAAGARAGDLVAGWLERQWNVAVDLGGRYEPLDVLRRLRREVAVIAAALPELGPRAAALAAALAGAGAVPGGAPVVLAHGSFSIYNVLELHDGLAVIDWDSFCQSRRELDAAAFLASLTRAATRSPALADPAARAATAFRAAIRDRVDPAALGWHEAAALVHRAGHVCVRRHADWPARTEHLLDAAAAAL
jgi:hypothetical protein